MKTNNDEAGLDGITKLYMCISEELNTAGDRYGGPDLEQYTQDFLVRVGVNVEEMD